MSNGETECVETVKQPDSNTIIIRDVHLNEEFTLPEKQQQSMLNPSVVADTSDSIGKQDLHPLSVKQLPVNQTGSINSTEVKVLSKEHNLIVAATTERQPGVNSAATPLTDSQLVAKTTTFENVNTQSPEKSKTPVHETVVHVATMKPNMLPASAMQATYADDKQNVTLKNLENTGSVSATQHVNAIENMTLNTSSSNITVDDSTKHSQEYSVVQTGTQIQQKQITPAPGKTAGTEQFPFVTGMTLIAHSDEDPKENVHSYQTPEVNKNEYNNIAITTLGPQYTTRILPGNDRSPEEYDKTDVPKENIRGSTTEHTTTSDREIILDVGDAISTTLSKDSTQVPQTPQTVPSSSLVPTRPASESVIIAHSMQTDIVGGSSTTAPCAQSQSTTNTGQVGSGQTAASLTTTSDREIILDVGDAIISTLPKNISHLSSNSHVVHSVNFSHSSSANISLSSSTYLSQSSVDNFHIPDSSDAFSIPDSNHVGVHAPDSLHVQQSSTPVSIPFTSHSYWPSSSAHVDGSSLNSVQLPVQSAVVIKANATDSHSFVAKLNGSNHVTGSVQTTVSSQQSTFGMGHSAEIINHQSHNEPSVAAMYENIEPQNAETFKSPDSLKTVVTDSVKQENATTKFFNDQSTGSNVSAIAEGAVIAEIHVVEIGQQTTGPPNSVVASKTFTDLPDNSALFSVTSNRNHPTRQPEITTTADLSIIRPNLTDLTWNGLPKENIETARNQTLCQDNTTAAYAGIGSAGLGVGVFGPNASVIIIIIVVMLLVILFLVSTWIICACYRRVSN
ncbi:uncharacterized protein DEA37_0008395 [Paragonimus westermani]|uniref:Uncharacterized protein n=1 Tax=Paragonimus westermani TaxID=34504 RepID=A0A5J4N3H5_9TREM|nr:uncharacterized protein DEA37_0008395 [Paragonimus westermani]